MGVPAPPKPRKDHSRHFQIDSPNCPLSTSPLQTLCQPPKAGVDHPSATHTALRCFCFCLLTVHLPHRQRSFRNQIVSFPCFHSPVETRTLLCGCWECKMVQLLWKTVWEFFRKLIVELPYDPAVSLQGIYPRELKLVHTKTHTQRIIATLFLGAKK